MRLGNRCLKQSGFMQDYTVQRCTRRCQKSDRPLEPGERFYSVVVAHGTELLRFDCSEKEWDGPPDGAIGWWRGRMPATGNVTRTPTPTGMLLETLSQLCECPEEASLAYLLGILLVRRRVLIEAEDASAGDQEKGSKVVEEPEYMHLMHPSDRREFWVPLLPPSDDQVESIQRALEDLIYQTN